LRKAILPTSVASHRKRRSNAFVCCAHARCAAALRRRYGCARTRKHTCTNIELRCGIITMIKYNATPTAQHGEKKRQIIDFVVRISDLYRFTDKNKGKKAGK
jgi:hypothetical protein